MGMLKATLMKPLHTAALTTGASTWLAGRSPVRRIVMLHGVGHDEFSAQAFERGLAWLAKRFTIVPLGEMLRGLVEGAAARHAGELALTFDDGLRNHAEVAYPILRRLGLPATFFVCPQLIEDRRWLWNHEARDRLLALPAAARRDYARSSGSAADDVASVIAKLKTLPLSERLAQEERLRHLTQGHEISEAARRDFDPMTWSDVEQLDSSLITIGSHTLTHAILPTLDDATLTRELAESRRMLEHRLGRVVDLFCYPNGSQDARVRKAVARFYRGAVTTEYGVARMPADPHRLPRIPVTPNLALLAWRMHRPTA